MNRFPIFDGHNDTLLRLPTVYDFFATNDQGHLDLPRARTGGMGGGFFAIFTPTPAAIDNAHERRITQDGRLISPLSPPIERAYALDHTVRVMAKLFALEEASEGKVKVVESAETLTHCLKNDIFAIILHIEGAEAIDTDLETLHVLYRAGLRSIGPVWSRPNAFGEGVPFNFPGTPDTGGGLTDAGKRLVRRCNQLGIVVDLAHITEQGFWDIAGLSADPLVATHASVHPLCPCPRNLTDAQIDAIGASNGVIGINFNAPFLRSDGMPNADTPLTTLVDHFDYVANRIGIDHVAFGSDFDGALMPTELKDATGLPKIIAIMRERGYSDSDLCKVTHENWLRILRMTWKK